MALNWIPMAGLIVAAGCVAAAYQLGLRAGYRAGREQGLNEGRREGKREGAKRGFAIGYDRGRRRGAKDDEEPAPGPPPGPSPRAVFGGIGLLLLLAVCGLICLPQAATRHETAFESQAPQLPPDGLALPHSAAEPMIETP